MKKPLLSIAVPTYEMPDADYFFRRLLESLWNQSFQNFEIVVTDNSENNEIKKICDWYKTGIRYFYNPKKGMAPNTNEAIKQSQGDYIKILYMDDYMVDDNAIKKIVDNLKGQWLVTGCTHSINGEDYFNNHYPTYSEDIHTGHNTIGSPSVLTIKNEDPLLFDEEMTWLLDCDLYKRYYDKYGPPTIIDEVNVIIGLHDGQLTHTMGDERKIKEVEYIRQKYA